MELKISTLLVAVLLASGASAQDQAAPANSRTQERPVRPTAAHNLSRVRSAFAASDKNHDGQIFGDEAQAVGVSRTQFAAFDADGDSKVTQDEFVVGYRQLVAQAGQNASPDLEAESARIQALRKANAAETERNGRSQGENASGARRAEGSGSRLPADATPERVRAGQPANSGEPAGRGDVTPERVRGSDGRPVERATDATPERVRDGGGSRPVESRPNSAPPASRPVSPAPSAGRGSQNAPPTARPQARPVRPTPRPAPPRPQPPSRPRRTN